MPVQDWKSNKAHGDVHGVYAKEIGRNALAISGAISNNNYVQMPNPQSNVKSLGLIGRYLYV
jgi:hypothetical protein